MIAAKVSIAPMERAYRRVRLRGNVLQPAQQPSTLKFRRSADFRMQHMVKFDDVAEFHSLAEYYHAALLEGNPAVDYYVPQPYALLIGGRRYVPDVYYTEAGKRYVLEIKPDGEFEEAKRIPLEAFFRQYQIQFSVISNESIFERMVAAQNWLDIIRRLVTGKHLDTEAVEWEVYEAILGAGALRLDALVDAGDREATNLQELAICRLLHTGRIETDLEMRFLGYDSELRACM